MENREYARLLSETADLMEIAAEDSFRIRSYRQAASAIEGYPEQLRHILQDPQRQVTNIPGVGKGIAAVIQEIAERGSFDRRDKLLAQYPPTVLEFLRIPGLGPKTIAAILEHFRISTLVELERLAQDQKLRDLPRMGAKLEEKILKGIAHYRQSAGRFLLHFATETAEELAAFLLRDGIDAVTPSGSVRRGRETVGDVDLLVTGPRAPLALDHFLTHPKVHDVLAKGENKVSARVGLEGLQVDVRTLPRESFGAALQYFTGSKEHNIVIRQRALKQGLTLNEYGLSEVDGGRIVAAATEEEVYARLGLAWIPPELRENQGEIEAAADGRLPRLIELADIRGDLHMHTRETDGRATLEEMAFAARELGHEYIVITDHSKALAMANGLDEKRTVAFAHQVRELDPAALGIRVFSGIECDILRDGSMDLADDALAELDFVVASVHSYLNLEPAEMTARLMRCLENPYVRVIGHPTGRMLLHREPYPFDFELVARECARRGVALEINASPERLDIHGALIRNAKALGCRFTISTDAHHPKHLRNMRYGVKMARRGWLGSGDVVNCLGVGEFAAFTRSRA
jgi:DNA polymerase (family 10)